MRRLAILSLRNRSFIALVCIAVALIGALSMSTLRQELIPSVSLPQIQVVTTSPGASSEQVASRISGPIEQSVRGLENVDSTTSTSQPSVSMVTIELKYGTDTARSANQVDAALARIKDDLPDGTDPQVIAGGSGDIPVAVLSISSDNEPATLAQGLRDDVVPELERVEGVSSVVVAGAPTQIVRITPDAQELASRGLTTADIKTALDANGLSVPGGTITDGDRSLDVTIGTQLTSIEDLQGIALLPAEGGQGGQQDATTLGQVAKVEQTQQAATSISRTDGRESLVLVVTATADGNVVDVSKGVESRLDELLPGLGGDAKSTVVFDQAPFIQKSILSLAEEGLLGLVFAIGVILLFLRQLRPTIVTAISIPMSLLMAFVGMLVSNYTLNMLTLAALTISIGRVVDDSIVVIENITRHLTYGKARARAIIDAVGEVAGAVTSSTLATVIVFLPVAVVSGMAGELFRPFSLTVAIAMLSSLIVSLTIVPVLAYWFLRAPRKAAVPTDPDDAAQVKAVRDAAEARESRSLLHRLYRPVLGWTQGHRVLTILLAVLVLVGTGFLVPALKINFLGDSGQNLASFTQTLPAGTTLDESSDKAAQAEKVLKDVDGVDSVQTTIGASAFGPAGGAGGQTNEISYSITTDPDADQEALRDTILKKLQGLPDAGDVEAQQSGGATGSSTVDIQITGPTDDARQKANDAILKRLDPLPSGVSKVESDLQADQPTAVITVDQTAAAQRGLTEQAVVGLVAQQLYPSSIGSITIDGDSLQVYVEQGTEPISTLDQLRGMQIAGMPLTDVARVDEQNSRPQIVTQDSRETVTIQLTPSSDNVGAATTAAQSAVDGATLPDGAKATVGGASADIGDTFGQLGIAMLAAVLLTYVLLVWIFKSLIQPLILLVSIPFAATGALGLLVITQVPLGLPSMIGLLMLVGIVVTNAIVLIDLVNQYRRHGMGLEEAVTTGASKRLRPILMTAAATIFALLPMAFGITGEGGFISQPLAVVVIGGLVSSTLLTLVIVPVLYRLAEGPGERRRLRRIAEGRGDEDGILAATEGLSGETNPAEDHRPAHAASGSAAAPTAAPAHEHLGAPAVGDAPEHGSGIDHPGRHATPRPTGGAPTHRADVPPVEPPGRPE